MAGWVTRVHPPWSASSDIHHSQLQDIRTTLREYDRWVGGDHVKEKLRYWVGRGYPGLLLPSERPCDQELSRVGS